MFKVKEAHTEKELDSIFALRYKILRKPWNQSFESVYDELEKTSTNVHMLLHFLVHLLCKH